MNSFAYLTSDPIGGQYDPATSFFIADDGTILILIGQGKFSSSALFTAPASASDPIQVQNITSLSAAGDVGQLTAMSANGAITGIIDGMTPVLWTSVTAAPQILPVPVGYSAAYRYVTSINDSGVVVGFLGGPSAPAVPYIWKDGKAVNINTLIPTGTGVTLTSGTLINDANVVVAKGNKVGSASAYYVLVPY